jgi:hypothetical protein
MKTTLRGTRHRTGGDNQLLKILSPDFHVLTARRHRRIMTFMTFMAWPGLLTGKIST